METTEQKINLQLNTLMVTNSLKPFNHLMMNKYISLNMEQKILVILLG